MKVYERRLQSCLRALEAEEMKMEAEEKKRAASNIVNAVNEVFLTTSHETKQPRLSQLMRESWEKRTWMMNDAARKSWVFDSTWWSFLDERYYGWNKYNGHQARLSLLSDKQREEMEPFVARKMDEETLRILQQRTAKL